MEPATLGTKYDRIARWWQAQHGESDYGLAAVRRALGFRSGAGRALDIGCGAGGRFVNLLEAQGYSVTGLDVSAEMIALARDNHRRQHFLIQDVCTWQTQERFDFILGWDSLFHLPLAMQAPVLSKLCGWLATGGVLVYTYGDAQGEHSSRWHDDDFYYSSIGVAANLRTLIDAGLSVVHHELDQYPLDHVVTTALRR